MAAEMTPLTITTEFLTKQLPPLIAINQFGSRARGEARPTSDIDLAVLARHPIPAEQLFEVAQDLTLQLHHDVDLVDPRAASTVMRMQVHSTGQRLGSMDDRPLPSSKCTPMQTTPA